MPQCLLNSLGEMGGWAGAGKGTGVLFIAHFITTAMLKLSTQALKAPQPSWHNRKAQAEAHHSASNQSLKPWQLLVPRTKSLLADFCSSQPQPSAVRGTGKARAAQDMSPLWWHWEPWTWFNIMATNTQGGHVCLGK